MVTEDPMVTLGVDLASQPKKTGVCLIHWKDGRACVEEQDLFVATERAEDKGLLKLFGRADKIGTDAPFGWPRGFTLALKDYSDPKRRSCWPSDDNSLRYRKTDRVVLKESGVRPLSVSSDWIAWTARRAARLLSKAEQEEPIDRSGGGRFVEVYPAAALKIWQLQSSGYKGSDGRANRINLVDELMKRTEWLDWKSKKVEAKCKKSDDALDALVAALVARAKAKCLCCEPKSETKKLAEEEGWIALPKSSESLDQLAG